MSEKTPNLDLPYLMAGQSQKHVTLNESLRLLDGTVHLSVKSRRLTQPANPSAPIIFADGVRYIPAPGAIGAWAGWDNAVAYWADGAWIKLTPLAGWLAWIQDEKILVVYDGDKWKPAVTLRYEFKAHLRQNDYIRPTAWATISPYETSVDVANVLHATTGIFTAPVDGTYCLGASILYKQYARNTSARMTARFGLKVGDSNVISAIRGSLRETDQTNITEKTSLHIQTLAKLDAGNEVQLQGSFKNSAGLFAASGTTFWGFLL